MVNLLKQAQDQLRQAVLQAYQKAVQAGALPQTEGDMPAFVVEMPADSKNGDFAANAAMVWARALRLAPQKIAQALCENISLEDTCFASCESAGPGFLNFRLADSFYQNACQSILKEQDAYGKSDFGAGKKVMVEFVSANPTGPMHMGNARGGALGDCLASVLDAAGYDVTREFYVNDAGNQIEKFANSLNARYLQLYMGEDAIAFPEDGYQGEDIKERAKEFAAVYADSFVNKPEDERKQALVDYVLPRNIQKMKDDLAKYRIFYDNWFLESSLHKNGDVKAVIDMLTRRGLTYEKDGALWYKTGQMMEKILPPRKNADAEPYKDDVLVRANGNPTYFAADIAYHYNKLVTRGFDKAIDVWGADHHGHVARMKGAMLALDIDPDRLDIVLMQLVRLTRNGEVVRMSKRTGKAITLTDLIEEVPIDAARFFFNLREPNSHLEFDMGLAVEQNAQNPVYYVQYAHARICSIFKNLAAEGIALDVAKADLAGLTEPEERALIKHIAGLTNEIIASAQSYDPARMTRYAIETATLFHKFYNACRVKGEEESRMMARLALCKAVQIVIKNVLVMLKIDVPESM